MSLGIFISVDFCSARDEKKFPVTRRAECVFNRQYEYLEYNFVTLMFLGADPSAGACALPRCPR